MTPEEDFAGRQILGDRSTQEDYYAFCPLEKELDGFNGLLLVLADGMGAYAGGSVASRLVTETFVEAFCETGGAVSGRLSAALESSHRSLIRAIAQGDETLAAMGSTLVGLVWTPSWIQWISVGDSPLFLYRDGALRRLNADHSMKPLLADMVAGGKLTDAEAAAHPDRNTLRSAIVQEGIEMRDLRDTPLDLAPGDIVAVTSDGVTNALDNAEIEQCLAGLGAGSVSHLADALLMAVNGKRKPKQDNATVAIIGMK